MPQATRPLKNRATGVSPLPLYRPLFRRVILQRMESSLLLLAFNRIECSIELDAVVAFSWTN